VNSEKIKNFKDLRIW